MMAEAGIFGNLLSGAVKSLAEPFLGEAKKRTKDFLCDSQSIKLSSPTDFALCDIPRQVSSLALSKNDVLEDQTDVISGDEATANKMMSLVERCKIPSRVFIVNWTTSDAAGTVLKTFDVSPSIVNYTFASPRYTVEATTPSYYGQFFRFWRGGLKFTFECLPTAFHQGQLYIAFNPNLAVLTLPGARNCTSATIDLGVQNRTSIEIPYVAQVDYLRTGLGVTEIEPWTLQNSLGTLTMFVQNELDTNGTVIGNIDINVYIEVLDDFEFKVPRSLKPGWKIFTKGAYQMEQEVVRNEASSPPVQQAPQGLRNTVDDNSDRVANVQTANTENVMSREYLIANGQNVNVASLPGTVAYFDNFPSKFFQAEFATTGLYNYHELYRMDFKFTVKLNPTPFNQGALMLVWIPGGFDTTGTSFGTYTQFPHCIINVGKETTGVLEVPYSSLTRMLRGTFPNNGVLRVMVWNQIKAPAAAPQQLRFSVWAQALNVHMAVKRQVGVQSAVQTTGVYQMELSSTAVVTSVTQDAFKKQGPDRPGFIVERHDNVLQYLRRFMLIGNAHMSTLTDPTTQLALTWKIPAFSGREHYFMLDTYAFSSGSNRIAVTTNMGRVPNITGFAIADYAAEFLQAAVTVSATSAVLPFGAFMEGAVQWYPSGEQQKIIEIPFYAKAPLMANPDASIQFPNAWPEISIGFDREADETNKLIRTYLWHAVGDDFRLYYPVCMHQMQYTEPSLEDEVDEEAEVQRVYFRNGNVEVAFQDNRNHVDILRSGDIEANPGPDEEDVRGTYQMFSVAGNMATAVKAVSDTAPAMAAAAKSVTETMPLLQTLLTKANVCANEVATVLNHRDDHILGQVMKIGEFLLDCFGHICNIVKGGVGRMASIAALILKIGKYLSTPLANKLHKLMESTGIYQGSFVEQILEYKDGIIGGVLALFNSEFGEDDKSSFAYRYEENARDCSNAGQKLKAFVETIIEYIYHGTGFCLTWYKCSHTELLAFNDAVLKAEVEKKFTVVSVKDQVVCVELRKLYKVARKIKSYGPAVLHFNMEYMKSADKVIQWMRLVSKEVVARHTPVGIALIGGSQVGKSYLSSHVLPTLLLLKSGLAANARDVPSLVWNKPNGIESHFCDGYTQQPIAYIDDFLKGSDARDAHDVINFISSSECPLDMAKLEDKGMLFKSDFVLVTSNIMNFGSVHGLSFPEALCTRFKNSVRVTTQNGRLGSECVEALVSFCEEKARSVDEMANKVDELWKFEKLNVQGGYVMGNVSFKQFVDQVVAEHVLKKDSTVRMTKAMMGVYQGEDDVFESCNDEDVVKGLLYAHQFRNIVEDYPESAEDYKEIYIGHFARAGVEPIKNTFDYMKLSEWPTEDIPGKLFYVLQPKPGKRWRGVLALLGVGVAAGTLYFVAKTLISYFSKQVVGFFQGAYEGKLPKPRKIEKGLLQGVAETIAVVRRNIRRIELFNEEDNERVGRMHAILLGGKDILMPEHFWAAWTKYRQASASFIMRIEHVNPRGESIGWHKVGFEPQYHQQMYADDNTALDLCVYHMHNVHINGARKITHLIPTIKEHRAMLCGKEMSGCLLYADDLDDINIRLGRREPVNFVGDEGERSFMMVAEMPSHLSTKGGDCGLPYVLMSNVASRPFVGMHSALLTNMTGSPAGCSPLVLEWVEKALARLPRSMRSEQVGVPQGDGTRPVGWDSSVACVGKAEMNGVPLKAYTPNDTVYRKWMKHDDWGNVYAPSRKGTIDGVSVLVKNAQKHDIKATKIVPAVVIHKCIKHYASKFEVGRDVAVLTDDEVINGKDPMQKLMWNTSCGFLTTWFKEGKNEVFTLKDGSESEREFSEKARTFIVPAYGMTFVQRYELVEFQMKHGIVPFMPWVATLKDELRPLEKVKVGKTRVFEQPPLEFTLLIRKYFGAFLNWLKRKPGCVTHSAIGIDKEERWKEFYIQLKLKGDKGFDVDYSNYDGSVSTQAFDFFRGVCNAYYGDNSAVRDGLLCVLQNAWIIVGDFLVFTEQGNKSGNPMTDVFNSITNVFIIYVSYLDGRVRSGLSFTLDYFERDIACLTYGDDVLVVADDDTLSYFNRVSVAECAASMGYVVTSANKSSQIIPVDRLEDLSFLKSRFVPDGQIVLAPMPLEVALRELQFIKKRNVDDARVQRDIIANALRFVAHVGRDDVHRLCEQLRDCGVVTEFDYDEFIMELHHKQFVYG